MFNFQVEQLAAKVFGRPVESTEQRSMLQSSVKMAAAPMAEMTQLSPMAEQMPQPMGQQPQQVNPSGDVGGGFDIPESTQQGFMQSALQRMQGASTNPAASQQVDPVDDALEQAKRSIIDANKRLQDVSKKQFTKELQLKLREELMSNKGLQELIKTRGELAKKSQKVSTKVKGSETVLPTTQGALQGDALGSLLKNMSDVSGAINTRGAAVNEIVSGIQQGQEQELQSAQAAQQGAQSLISGLTNINQESRAQQLFPLQIQTEKLQQQKIRADISKTLKEAAGAGKLDEMISDSLAEKLGVPVGATYRDVMGQVIPQTPTDAQANAATFWLRATNSNNIISNNDMLIGKMNPLSYAAQRALPNIAKSDLIQGQEQAERDFVNAILRRESGAVINPDEFANARIQYFPQPGDSQKTIQQKKKNRTLALTGIKQSAGKAATNLEGVIGQQTGVPQIGQTFNGQIITNVKKIK
jgi:hypothetical protein